MPFHPKSSVGRFVLRKYFVENFATDFGIGTDVKVSTKFPGSRVSVRRVYGANYRGQPYYVYSKRR